MLKSSLRDAESVHREFAPGAEPGFWDTLVARLAESAAGEQTTLVLMGVGGTLLLHGLIRTHLRRAARPARSGALPAVASDRPNLASLRRARAEAARCAAAPAALSVVPARVQPGLPQAGRRV